MRNEIETLTALRGIVALWVVIFHYHVYFTPQLTGPLIERGYLAVDVFFVLSGFIMYYVYAESLGRRTFSYVDFITKRVARIYPVHLVTLLTAFVVFSVGSALNFVPASRSHVHVADAWAHLLLLHAWGVTTGLHLNYPSWSVSAEFFAYALFPVLATGAIRMPRRALPIFAVVLFFLWLALFNSLVLPHLDADSMFRTTYDFSTLRILPEFFLGLVAACLVIGREIRWAGGLVFGVLIVMFVALYLRADAVFVLLVPIFIAALYLWRVPVPKLLRWMGVISFSLYMVHALVELVAFQTLMRVTGWGKGSFPLEFLPGFILVAIAVGWACWRFIEEPGRHLITLASARFFGKD